MNSEGIGIQCGRLSLSIQKENEFLSMPIYKHIYIDHHFSRLGGKYEKNSREINYTALLLKIITKYSAFICNNLGRYISAGE